MQFLDEAKIYVKSGNGGPGCVSFRREKNIPHGGPDGGNGGRGADVILKVVSSLNTLIDFRYQQHFKAKNGEHGKGDNRFGASARALVIKVPAGTQIFAEDGVTLLVDLVQEGEEFMLAKGGDGGFGNAHYKTSVNQAPRKFTKGFPGEELWVWLRLKLIADIGLIGLPNAGKSTFLSRVSAARPKIADYPFTTLKPQLGVVNIDDREFVIADLPGLIENAHLGVGLGDKFLKHSERCGVLLHLLDVTLEDIVKSYQIIRKELNEYSSKLGGKKEILALNKCDALPAEVVEQKRLLLQDATGKIVSTISGATGQGVTKILRELSKEINI